MRVPLVPGNPVFVKAEIGKDGGLWCSPLVAGRSISEGTGGGASTAVGNGVAALTNSESRLRKPSRAGGVGGITTAFEVELLASSGRNHNGSELRGKLPYVLEC